MTVVGLIGFGTMGSKAAEKILRAGYSLWVYDQNQAAGEQASTLGASITASPGEVAERVDLVLMFLPGPKEVEACVMGPKGLLSGIRFGGILTDLSTVDPGTTIRLAEAVRAKEAGYLDAPVLGRPASIGNWALPVGGESSDLESCRSILELLASKIYHVGPSGSGNKVKLLNQLMFGAINAMTAEMMAVADQVGIAPRLLYEIIINSGAATVSNLFKELGQRISTEDYLNPTFSVDLLVKDVRLAARMAGENEAPPILTRTIELINEIAQVQGLGGYDTSIMWKSYQRVWKGKKP